MMFQPPKKNPCVQFLHVRILKPCAVYRIIKETEDRPKRQRTNVKSAKIVESDRSGNDESDSDYGEERTKKSQKTKSGKKRQKSASESDGDDDDEKDVEEGSKY